MRHALSMPPFDALADPHLLADLAAEAESAGWDGFFLWDHLLYTPPVEQILDPFVCLAAVALATERVALGPMVTPLPRRRPAVLARQAVTLDHLSRGRLVLGLGLGDDGARREMSAFGDEPDAAARAELLDEGLELLSALLSGRPVDHDGPRYRARQVRFLPTAYRPSGIPIWLAARWPHRAPVRRAARADGLFAIQLERPEDAALLRRWLAEAGAREGFELVVEDQPGADPRAFAEAGVDWLVRQFRAHELDLAVIRQAVAAGPRR